MCGIVGYVGARSAIEFLLPALSRLEYRGYDSAGLATLNGRGVEICKAVGRIAELETKTRLDGHSPSGRIGIGHTRWATHGKPSEPNAHPHVDCAGRLAVVHNGIIENFQELRDGLLADGHTFRSETDTEVIAHLIEQYDDLSLPEAVLAATRDLEGAFALACIAERAPDQIVALRRGSSPLIIGRGADEWLLASDIPALLGATERYWVLEDGDMAVLSPAGLVIVDAAGNRIEREPHLVTFGREAAERGGYPHFMLKEIHEQPDAVERTLAGRLGDEAQVQLDELGLTERELAELRQMTIVACGTSWHAGLVGRYLLEHLARIPVDIEVASEFRYRKPHAGPDTLTVPISQSGETADTLAAMRSVRERGGRLVAICNVVGSSVARESDGVVLTRAGIEIGVASTKAFTAQLTALVLLAMRLGRARGLLARDDARALGMALGRVPDQMAAILDGAERLRRIAEQIADRDSALFIGRSVQYPMALEGALKMKEVSYVHAQGYAAGELKHGPIALVQERVPVIAIVPRDATYDKMRSNVSEVCSRGAQLVAITTADENRLGASAELTVQVPQTLPWLQPLLVALPLQLIAYHVGVLRGCDVDKPRNLAKSVTVE